MIATAIKERPILFSGPMVLPTLDGRKTQTRRTVKLPLIDRNGTGCEIAGCEINSCLKQGLEICPYGKPGDRLWVKETFGFHDENPVYRADAGPLHMATTKWKPSIFMPRWASRITLEIVNVRVERVQDISEWDAIKEGVDPCGHVGFHVDDHTCSFHSLWDSINSKRGYSWDSNPWVWAIEFKKL